MSTRYIIEQQENASSKFGLADNAISMTLEDNGSLVIKQDYKDITVSKEILDSFSNIFRIIYQDFCERYEEFVDDNFKNKNIVTEEHTNTINNDNNDDEIQF